MGGGRFEEEGVLGVREREKGRRREREREMGGERERKGNRVFMTLIERIQQKEKEGEKKR